MEKDVLITRIKDTSGQFTTYMRRLQEQDRLNDQYNSTWKIKDILAHVLWYEEEIAEMLKLQSITQSSSIWNNELDERNALIYEEMKDIESEELMERHEKAVEKIVNTVSDLTDTHMTDPSLFEGMPEEWKPWQIIGGSTFFHYTDHLRRLKEFEE